MVLVAARVRLVVVAAPAQHTGIMVTLDAGISCSNAHAESCCQSAFLSGATLASKAMPMSELLRQTDHNQRTGALLDAQEVLVLGQGQDEVVRNVLACIPERRRKLVHVVKLT